MKELVNMVTNSVVLSHALSDCLNIMVERGFLYHDLKSTAKRYEAIIERNNKQIYKSVSDERMALISKEIDQHTLIFKKLNRMSFEEKEELLNSLK